MWCGNELCHRAVWNSCFLNCLHLIGQCSMCTDKIMLFKLYSWSKLEKVASAYKCTDIEKFLHLGTPYLNFAKFPFIHC